MDGMWPVWVPAKVCEANTKKETFCGSISILSRHLGFPFLIHLEFLIEPATAPVYSTGLGHIHYTWHIMAYLHEG